jgi:ethanolamine utilization protein EutQ (cupin superfamily)
MQELPLVIRWDTFPLDISDPKRFKVSQFNYLYKNHEAKLIMGYWEAEDGVEIIGEMVGGGTSDEIMVVLEGQLYVSTPGEPSRVARPGDLVACLRNRETRIEVRERTRVFFVVQGIQPDVAEGVMRGLAQQ